MNKTNKIIYSVITFVIALVLIPVITGVISTVTTDPVPIIGDGSTTTDSFVGYTLDEITGDEYYLRYNSSTEDYFVVKNNVDYIQVGPSFSFALSATNGYLYVSAYSGNTTDVYYNGNNIGSLSYKLSGYSVTKRGNKYVNLFNDNEPGSYLRISNTPLFTEFDTVNYSQDIFSIFTVGSLYSISGDWSLIKLDDSNISVPSILTFYNGLVVGGTYNTVVLYDSDFKILDSKTNTPSLGSGPYIGKNGIYALNGSYRYDINTILVDNNAPYNPIIHLIPLIFVAGAIGVIWVMPKKED